MSPQSKTVIASAIQTATGYTNEIKQLKIECNNKIEQAHSDSIKMFMNQYLELITEQDADKAENERLKKEIIQLKKIHS
jgi:hypothetical protein